jgi:pyruvate dehydrogenase E1 component alpha subunit
MGIGMGAALGIKLSGDKKVAVGFVGDGGMNTGRTWEAINMAAIWKLPLIVVVDNNQYAVETFIDRVTAGGDLPKRASGFGLPASTIDGQNVMEVIDAVTKAREFALAGNGPTFLNAVTYRYNGHNVGEKGQYRTLEEIEDWRNNRDPIDRFAAQLFAEGVLDQPAYDEMTASVDAEVQDAVEFAESSPNPSPADVMKNVDSGKLRG